MSGLLSRRSLMLGAGGIAAAWPLLKAAGATAQGARSAIRIANASGSLNQTMDALMHQQHFLEDFGLTPEVLEVADGTRILGALVSGSIDTSMMSGFGQVFPAVERGAPIRIIAGGALRPTLALFSAKQSVKAVQDLAGKTVGTGSIGALIYQLSVALLEKYGVDRSTVQFVAIGSSADIFRAVRVGIIDAGVGESALIAEASQYGVHLVEHGDMSLELPEYTFQGAWTSEEKIRRDRSVLVRALAAYAKLYRFVQSPGSQAEFLSARRTVFPNAAEADHMAQWNYIQSYHPYAVNLTLAPERLQYMQALNMRFNVQSGMLPFDRVADMSLATEALGLLAAGR